jgi:hypothetical protein
MSYSVQFARLQASCLEFIRESFAWPEAVRDERFQALALEIFQFQYRFNTPYQKFCDLRRAKPGSVESWQNIPALPASAWKEFEITTLPPEERTAVFFSSGTTSAKRSRNYHSAASLAVYEESLSAWFCHRLLRGVQAPVFLCLAPSLAEAPNSSLVHMFQTVQNRFAGPAALHAARAEPDGSWNIDFRMVREFANRWRNSEETTLILLGTAFSFVHLCDHISSTDGRWRLPASARVMETGGYKGRSRALDKAELHTLISDRLGLPSQNIVTEYGMSELASQAYDRVAGEPSTGLQFPPWARPRIVSPETLKPVEPGEKGLLQIFDLASFASAQAIQTEDLARHGGFEFELLGRAPAAEPRGCSLMNI